MYCTEHCNFSSGMQTISHEHKTNLPQSNGRGSPQLVQLHSMSSSSITHLAPLVVHCNSSSNSNNNNNTNSYYPNSSTPSCTNPNTNLNTNTNANKTKRSTRVRREYQSPYRQLPQRKSQHRQTESSTTTFTRQTSLPTSLPQTAPEHDRSTETLSNSTTTLTTPPTTTININTTPFLSPAWSPLARQPSAPNTFMQPQETIHNKERNTINSNNATPSSSSISGSGNNNQTHNINVNNKMRNVNITRLRNRELPPLSQTISHSSRANKSLMLPNKFSESTHAHNQSTFNHLRTQPASEHHFAFSTLSPPPPPLSSSSFSSSSQSLFLSPETLSTLSPHLCPTLDSNQSNVLLHKELHDQALRILDRPSKPIGLHNATIPKITENIIEPSTNVAAKITGQENSKANQAINNYNADYSTIDVSNIISSVYNVNFFRLSADELYSFGTEATRTNQVNANGKSTNKNVCLSESSNSCVNESTMSNFIALSSLQQQYAEEHELHSIFTAMARDLLAAEPCDPQE